MKAVPSAPKKAVLYLRQSVSRDDSISIELQELAGRNHCEQNGYDVVGVEVDEGLSGRNWSKRPAVQRVMDMIDSRAADVIVLWKWSRLSRNRKDWAIAADRVDIAGGRIESATEPIDTATASGRFARGVMTEYAAFQSEQIGEQWQEVFARRVSLGLPPTGSMPWGWRLVDGVATISEGDRATIRSMYAMYAEGSGLVAIANWLNENGHRSKRGNLWQFAAVRGCLESPFHSGQISFNGELVPGVHDGVISPDEYARFMDRRRDRSIAKRPRVSPYLLSTLAVCHCGRKRVGNVSNSRLRSYTCTATEKHPRKTRVCEPVDELVGRWVMGLPIGAEVIDTSAPVDTSLLAGRLKQLNQALVNLNINLAMERLSTEEHAAARSALQSEIAELESQQADAAKASRNSASHYLEGRTEALRHWPALKVDEQQSFLRATVRFVEILADDTIKIHTQWGDIVHCGN
ncbi:recombinase family protein [Leucobacter japonicus]|uniref:recombinase family protein n=1 Tax=Leucobacter japonicus TaxID=1461259 RepID=UPI00138ECEBA|nr:recombinase family protein [Leucobacter japonicus]